MPSRKNKQAPKRKAPKPYKLPDPISKGEVMIDSSQRQWIVGESIGIGGFGEIYSAAPYSGKAPKNYWFVIKIEPRENGPLFVEKNFYIRNCKPNDIEAWMKKKKLHHLGMPKFIGTGSHKYHSKEYRFLVMDRYGTDLGKLFKQNGRKFPEETVYKIALQIINVLEYIHSRGYIHADIKAANVLMDLKSANNVYLVDFGLAERLPQKLVYKPDKKRAHNGTIEYTSRDAHVGVPTMRGDLEILAYNMIHWLCSSLPWDSNLKNLSVVQKKKEKAFENVDAFLKQCFGSQIPAPMSKFMKLLAKLKFDETPNHAEFCKILVRALKNLSSNVNGKLEFSEAAKVSPRKFSTTRAGLEKLTVRAPKRKVAGVKKSPTSLTSCSDVSTASEKSSCSIVVDKKRETIRGLRKLVDNLNDDSDIEYDIYITKRRKISQTKKTKTVSRKISTRRVRTRSMDSLVSSDVSSLW